MCCEVFDASSKRYRSSANPIQAAVTDAANRGGGVVYVPGGDPWQLPSGIIIPWAVDSSPFDPAPAIHLVGDGPDNTIIERLGGGAAFSNLEIRRSSTTVSGITFDGSAGSAFFGHGIVVGEVHSPGQNDNRVVRGIRLNNCVVRGAAQNSLYLPGGINLDDPLVQPPISLDSSFTDCMFSANRGTGPGGGIAIEARCMGHSFRGCHVDLFRNRGIRLSQCNGVSFHECTVEATQSNDQPYVDIDDARGCEFLDCWFEETQSSAGSGSIQWFLSMSGRCTGTTIANCQFIRKQNLARVIRMESGAEPPVGVVILSPTIYLTGLPPGGEPSEILILDPLSEVALFGGVVLVVGSGTTVYRSLEVQDTGNFSAAFAPMQRLRLPKLSSAEIAAWLTSNRRTSDVVNRLLGASTIGAGLEAFNNNSTWLPLTVNRYASAADLTASTSRDRGTLAWLDSPPSLKVFDGSAWQTVWS